MAGFETSTYGRFSGVDRGVDLVAQSRRPRVTPLSVAIETGQHDLVRLLLAAGYRPDLEPWSPFDQVLRDRRPDLLELLLEADADPKTVDPDAVFGTYSTEVMERFRALGVDLAANGAMAEALATATRNRPLYGFAKNHTHVLQIQRELDIGLGYAIGRKNDKAISLCLWAGANPRHSVPAMGDGQAYTNDWRMTAFERAVWEGAPHYLEKLGFDPEIDDIERLYEVALDASEVEALCRIRSPKDWHSIAERFLDRAMFRIDLGTGTRWRTTRDLERIFQIGGRLGLLSGLAKRRLRKHLKTLPRDEARRLLRLLEKHTSAEAFLDLIAYPIFMKDYKDWGLKRRSIEEIAGGLGGSIAASAKARRVLKAEKMRPPTMHIPWSKNAYERWTREDLYELVWSTPIVKASMRFGLSDNGLRKICRKLDVPTPPRGYWATRRARPQIPLPKARPGWPLEAWLPRITPSTAKSR